MALLDLNEKLRLLKLKNKIDNIISNGPSSNKDKNIFLISEDLSLNNNRKKLTLKQSIILEFIIDHMAKAGIPPSRAEISKHFGFKSFNSPQEHLKALEKKGYLDLKAGCSRAVKII